MSTDTGRQRDLMESRVRTHLFVRPSGGKVVPGWGEGRCQCRPLMPVEGVEELPFPKVPDLQRCVLVSGARQYVTRSKG